MKAQIQSSELAICSNNYYYAEKAWHLASIILSLGRPASPAELAARCSLFQISPEFIEILCSIPDSPIYLTANNFVVLSMAAFSAVSEFFATSMPNIELRLNRGERKLCSGDDFVRRFFRKRKKLEDEIIPVLKKRAVSRSVDENERETTSLRGSQGIVSTCFQRVDLQTDPGKALSALSFDIVPVNLVNASDMAVTPSMVKSSIQLLEYQQNIDGNQESSNKHEKFEVNDIDNCVVKDEYQDKCYANRTCLDLPNCDGKVCKDPLLETLAEISAMLEDNHDVTNLVGRMDNDVPFCQELDQADQNLTMDNAAVINAAKNFRHSEMPVTKMVDLNEQPLMDNGGPGEKVESILFGSWRDIYCSADKLCQTKMHISTGEKLPVRKKQTNFKSAGQPLVSVDPQSSAQMAQTKSSVLKNVTQAEPTQNQKNPSKLIPHEEVYIIQKQQTTVKSISQPLVSVDPQSTAQMEQRKSLVLLNGTQAELTQDQKTPSKLTQDQKTPSKLTQDQKTPSKLTQDQKTPSKLTQDKKVDIIHKEQTNIESFSQPLISVDPQSSAQMEQTNSLVLKNVTQIALTQNQKTPSKLMQHKKVDIIHKEQRHNKHRITMAMMDKSTHIVKNSASIQERQDNGLKSSKDQQKPKFPEFEPYTVEEEEGSGGYGTVYRARRKADGLTFAIKCPHVNAQKQHVKNELKMLERFGGRNYVIRYEGCLKSESSDCFVLEHVAHDRPEVLKREIDISQLQWYGYCMFKALVSLHKQGVYHRDIKPGNFLFSCKSLKGYLIDFNLARDLNQKHGSIGQFKPISPNKRKQPLGAPESKPPKKKPVDKLKAYEDLGRCNPLTSQGADGSGLTSARDMCTRTPSAERLREPLPCKGRKALINIAQEAMQSPNHGATKAPASNRKRVAASPGISDRKLIHPSPTPLHSSGVAIPGAGSLKFRGEVKPNKDGPCAGTKGFRAPEVLLRSLHQGPKVDVWSAGVTLLYLISGKMPFIGDPEQNMKDIVKLRGNEELWEVAKLHNRESSFPVELLDIRFLPSMTIRDWYSTNTKRQDLLGVIPDSLFDLLEKCLTVSPRLRITAEQALNHEFFAPCHEFLHKQRLSRHGHNQGSKSNSLPLLCEPVRAPKEKLVAPVNL